MKFYGNLNNRFDEGKNYNKDKKIHVGDDITMYLYSDRDCYYVTEVVNEKCIKVRPYNVCANHSIKDSGTGHQKWLYFKTLKEMNIYLNTIFPGNGYNENPFERCEECWVYRYNNWYRKIVFNKRMLENQTVMGPTTISPRNLKKFENGDFIVEYHKLPGKISFGVRDYYFDWEF